MPAEDAVLGQGDSRWGRLHEIIADKSLKFGDFILTSGARSNYLFQLRQTTMMPEGAALIGEIVVDFMRGRNIRCVGGLELGAVPLVSAISAVSHYKDYPVDAFFVRKSTKTHGARERIDGYVRDGEEVLFVDDVATSGKSILTAVEVMKEEFPRSTVRTAFVVVDRQEGATQNLAERGIELVSIFKKSDFPIKA
ncbi:MAG: orotate phosphoribosyltransferase [Methylovirgula sp.]